MHSIFCSENRHGFSDALILKHVIGLRRGDITQDKGLDLPELQATLFECPENRALIDCHLLSSYYHNPLFKLQPQNTYHYHNLPDLTHHLRDALTHRSFNWNLVSATMGIFCLQNKLKRCYINALALCERKALTNILHGLLLGLYPYNVQHGQFQHRCAVAAKLRELMISNTYYEHLVQLAMVEYLSNVLADFCPVEYQLLIKSPSSRATINQLCDAFRQNNNTLDFDILEAAARETLFNIQRYLKQMHVKLYRKTSSRYMKVTDHIIESALALPHIPFSPQLSQIFVLCEEPLAVLQGIEFVWQNCTIMFLPQSIYEQQMRVVNSLSASQTLQSCKCTVWFCLFCALTNKRDILQHKSSYDAFDHHMYCHKCDRRQISVNLLGRVLRVRNTSYSLCSKCLTPTIWGEACRSCVIESKPVPIVCLICENKHVVFTRMVLNVRNLRIEPVYLCSKHAKHNIKASTTVYDLDMLIADATAK